MTSDILKSDKVTKWQLYSYEKIKTYVQDPVLTTAQEPVQDPVLTTAQEPSSSKKKEGQTTPNPSSKGGLGAGGLGAGRLGAVVTSSLPTTPSTTKALQDSLPTTPSTMKALQDSLPTTPSTTKALQNSLPTTVVKGRTYLPNKTFQDDRLGPVFTIQDSRVTQGTTTRRPWVRWG